MPIRGTEPNNLSHRIGCAHFSPADVRELGFIDWRTYCELSASVSIVIAAICVVSSPRFHTSLICLTIVRQAIAKPRVIYILKAMQQLADQLLFVDAIAQINEFLQSLWAIAFKKPGLLHI